MCLRTQQFLQVLQHQQNPFAHGGDQRRVKSAKSLSYEEILPKPNPEEVIHVPLTMVSPTLPSLDFVVANNVKISSEGHCDGDICKKQVSLNNNAPLCQERGIFLFKTTS